MSHPHAGSGQNSEPNKTVDTVPRSFGTADPVLRLQGRRGVKRATSLRDYRPGHLGVVSSSLLRIEYHLFRLIQQVIILSRTSTLARLVGCYMSPLNIEYAQWIPFIL